MESLLIKTVSNTSYINKGENQDLNTLIPDKASSYSYTYTLAKAGSSINQPNGASTNDITWYVISNNASTDGSVVQMAYCDDPSTMYVRYKNLSGWTQWNPLSTVPTMHASPRSTYGPASTSNFGHVKLTDQLNVSGQAADGVALSASAGAKITEAIGKATGALPVDGLVGQILTRTDKETPVGEWKDPSFVYLDAEGEALPINPDSEIFMESIGYINDLNLDYTKYETKHAYYGYADGNSLNRPRAQGGGYFVITWFSTTNPYGRQLCIHDRTFSTRSLIAGVWQNWTTDSTILDDAGVLEIKGSATGTGSDKCFKVTSVRSDVYEGQPVSVALMVGSGGLNHGVWSFPLNKWMLYGNDKNVFLNGQNITKTDFGYKYTEKISDFATINSAVVGSVIDAYLVKCGKVVQIYMRWTNKEPISVPASGNISNLKVATLKEAYWPKVFSGGYSVGDVGGAAWYNINKTDGRITLGACEGTGVARTIAANTEFQFNTTYILPEE